MSMHILLNAGFCLKINPLLRISPGEKLAPEYDRNYATGKSLENNSENAPNI